MRLCGISFVVFVLLISPLGAQNKTSKPKPVPHVSDTVARQCFVLMQFIDEHGTEEAHDTFIAQEIDRLRTFNDREVDQDLIDLVGEYASVEAYRGLVQSAAGNLADVNDNSALIEKTVSCGSMVRKSIVTRHVVKMAKSDACNIARGAVMDAMEKQHEKYEKEQEQRRNQGHAQYCNAPCEVK